MGLILFASNEVAAANPNATMLVHNISEEQHFENLYKHYSKIYNFCPNCASEIVNLNCVECKRDWSEEIFSRHALNIEMTQNPAFQEWLDKRLQKALRIAAFDPFRSNAEWLKLKYCYEKKYRIDKLKLAEEMFRRSHEAAAESGVDVSIWVLYFQTDINQMPDEIYWKFPSFETSGFHVAYTNEEFESQVRKLHEKRTTG